MSTNTCLCAVTSLLPSGCSTILCRKEIHDAEENVQVQEMRQDIHQARAVCLAHAEHAWSQEEEENESDKEGETARQEADDEESWSPQRLNESVWFEEYEAGAAHAID